MKTDKEIADEEDCHWCGSDSPLATVICNNCLEGKIKKARESLIKNFRDEIDKAGKHCHIGDEWNKNFPRRDEWVSVDDLWGILNKLKAESRDDPK